MSEAGGVAARLSRRGVYPSVRFLADGGRTCVASNLYRCFSLPPGVGTCEFLPAGGLMHGGNGAWETRSSRRLTLCGCVLTVTGRATPSLESLPSGRRSHLEN